MSAPCCVISVWNRLFLGGGEWSGLGWPLHGFLLLRCTFHVVSVSLLLAMVAPASRSSLTGNWWCPRRGDVRSAKSPNTCCASSMGRRFVPQSCTFLKIHRFWTGCWQGLSAAALCIHAGWDCVQAAQEAISVCAQQSFRIPHFMIHCEQVQ